MVWINTWNKLEEKHEVIVVKKIFLVAMVSLLVLTTSTASAIGRLSNSDEVLAEMYSNMPNDYYTWILSPHVWESDSNV